MSVGNEFRASVLDLKKSTHGPGTYLPDQLTPEQREDKRKVWMSEFERKQRDNSAGGGRSTPQTNNFA